MDKKFAFKVLRYGVLAVLLFVFVFKFNAQFLSVASFLSVKSAQMYIPSAVDFFEKEESKAEKNVGSNLTEKNAKAEPNEKVKTVLTVQNDFFETPADIQVLIDSAKERAKTDKKDGAIFEKTYTNEGVTNKFQSVKLKNTNKTQIDLPKLLEEKADLSVSRDKPSVLIFHTHTTESYQTLDRDFYSVGYITRSNDKTKNMVRVGDAICEEIEKAGFKVIHDSTIYDTKYNGSYERSRAGISKILKENPSIQVVLDIHRDAIQNSDGTKIKPTASLGEKKAAQVMIISGCQEKGNGIENFTDWKYNLIFALKLQKEMEEAFPSLTRPIFFCPRKYNMNITRCSLLLEVGSDSNTLEEAYFSGKCIGKSLSNLLEDYVQ